MEACPVDAISYAGRGGAIVVDPEICNSCEACVGACPYHAMRFDNTARVAFTCDLCDGDSECVKVCAAGALRLVRLSDVDPLERAIYGKQLESREFW